jgi:large subunit ribosomal protein L10
MAISKDKKQQLVADLNEILSDAKMTVFAKYQGLSVQEMQELRALARESGVQIKVVKNRLVRVAMGEIAAYKDTDTTALEGQLLYAISSEDEVAPAQVLAKFAKDHTMLELKGAFSADGKTLSEQEVQDLSKLPSKEQLIGQVVDMLLSPVNDITNGLSGNLHALLDGVAEKANAYRASFVGSASRRSESCVEKRRAAYEI